MCLAKDRDNIARQYANGYDDILHFGLEQLSQELGFVDRWENAIIRLQLQLMSHVPDSLIARKCGSRVAYEAGLRARTVLETDWPDYDITWELLQEFDDWLRAEGNSRNPGATADLIVACYTLQFVAPRVRQQVFTKIHAALNWGGGFLLVEKVRAPDARFQDMMSTLYTDYKLEQGYTGDEIVAKTRSLKGVLEPFSSAGNLGLLERAGFVDVTSVFKYLCFEGFLAIK